MAATRRRDRLVGQRVGDPLDARLRPEVRGRGVAGVDREELPLDVRREVVDEVRAGDLRRVVAERRALDRPLVERLDRDIHAAPGRLRGHDPVDGGVGEHGAAGQPVPGVAGERRISSRSRSVALIAFSHAMICERRRRRVPQREPRDDVRRDEPQDGRPDRRRHDVRRGDLVDHRIGVRGAVDRPEAGDDRVAAALADGVHGVPIDRVDRVDERRGDIREDELVPALVQQQADEAAPDVAGAEVDGLHRTPSRDQREQLLRRRRGLEARRRRPRPRTGSRSARGSRGARRPCRRCRRRR